MQASRCGFLHAAEISRKAGGKTCRIRKRGAGKSTRGNQWQCKPTNSRVQTLFEVASIFAPHIPGEDQLSGWAAKQAKKEEAVWDAGRQQRSRHKMQRVPPNRPKHATPSRPVKNPRVMHPPTRSALLETRRCAGLGESDHWSHVEIASCTLCSPCTKAASCARNAFCPARR